MIAILGPTATGKTKLAAHLAYRIDGEVISADSRQVYKYMNLGTGKDYNDYLVRDKRIPYHLIDIQEPGTEYNLFRFREDFYDAYRSILDRKKIPVLCGGSGMYLEAVLKAYDLKEAPRDEKLRKELAGKSNHELIQMLKTRTRLHNITDISDRKRLVRAIEIAFSQNNGTKQKQIFPEITSKVFGIHFPREILKKRITERLHRRLENGMVEEVDNLMKRGVSARKMKYYGLEYKYITEYILGERSYDQMVDRLNIAIHQFSKRQMTWFRRMERTGISIIWLDGQWATDDKVNFCLKMYDIE